MWSHRWRGCWYLLLLLQFYFDVARFKIHARYPDQWIAMYWRMFVNRLVFQLSKYAKIVNTSPLQCLNLFLDVWNCMLNFKQHVFISRSNKNELKRNIAASPNWCLLLLKNSSPLQLFLTPTNRMCAAITINANAFLWNIQMSKRPNSLGAAMALQALGCSKRHTERSFPQAQSCWMFDLLLTTRTADVSSGNA